MDRDQEKDRRRRRFAAIAAARLATCHPNPEAHDMWKGRFTQQTADLVQRYGESISYDWRLFPYDIAGSIAHARAQMHAGLLTDEEFSQIESGLHEIKSEIEAGKFEFSIELEDIHMNIEAALTRKIGAAGSKLHTARSRNDQVATDTRLYCRSSFDSLLSLSADLQRALLLQAEKHAATILPGYTHLQRGQPVTAGHHLLAYVEMLERDKQRLTDCRKRLNVCPLGSGALAGSTINLDRSAIAQELGFEGISTNSMDAIADRDYVAEMLFVLSLLGTHLSRFSEDIILWCSAEFGFATLSDSHTTGSSLMPQKKNPDVCELTRGRAGRLVGNLVALLTALKGLPLTYNRDLQEDKEPLFDSIETLTLALEVNAAMVSSMDMHIENCRKAADDPLLLATDLADYLVGKGVPFRNAHELVGQAVAAAEEQGTTLDMLDLSLISGEFGADTNKVFDLDVALQARSNPGSPSPANVLGEVERWKTALA